MRFKAKLAPEQISLLLQIISPMVRIAATTSTSNMNTNTNGRGPMNMRSWTQNACILHMDDHWVRLYCKGKQHDTDQMMVYTELAATSTGNGNGINGSSGSSGSIFLGHKIQSNAEGNAICMEIDLVQFRLILQSLLATTSSSDIAASNQHPHHQQQQQHCTILKLANRNNIPCLCFDSMSSSSCSASDTPPIQVHYSIAVRILRLADMVYFRPPDLQNRNPNRNTNILQLELPHDRPFKTLVEGLRNVASNSTSSSTTNNTSSFYSSSSTVIALTATSAGELTLSLDSDGAIIRAFLHHLPVVAMSNDDNHVENDNNDMTEGQGRRRRDKNDDETEATTYHHRVKVKVDLKKLLICLQSHFFTFSSSSLSSSLGAAASGGITSFLLSHKHSLSPPPPRLTLCFLQNEMLLVHVEFQPPPFWSSGSGSMMMGRQTYYIPVHYISPDDEEHEDD